MERTSGAVTGLLAMTTVESQSDPTATLDDVADSVTSAPGLYTGEEISVTCRVTLFSLYLVSSVVGLCGSVLIVFTLVSDVGFRHHSATYMSYLSNLVVTDLFFNLYYFPFLAAGLLMGRYPVLGEAHCLFNGFIFFTASIVFMFTLAAISFDRYMFICRWTWHGKLFSRRSSVGVCLVLWLAAGVFCVPSALDGTIGFDEKTRMCFLQHTDLFTPGHAITVAVVSLALLGVGVPSVFIFRSYRASRRRVAEGASTTSSSTAERAARPSVSRNDIALLRSLAIIFLAFFLLTFPATVAFVLRRSTHVSPCLYGLFIWLYAVNSSINWIIYGVMYSRFRKGYLQAVRKLQALCKKA